MRPTRRSLLRTLGIAGACGVAGTAAARGRQRHSDEGTWTATYDAGQTEYADAAARTDDGFLLAGRSSDGGDTAAYWTLELGPDGEQRGATTFELDARGTVSDVLPTADGAVVVGTDLGPTDAVTASWTPWAAKVTGDGVDWTYRKDRDEVERDHRVGSVARTADGEFMVVGTLGIREPDAWRLRLSADGSAAGEWTDDGDRPSAFFDVTALDDGSLVVGGTVGSRRDSAARLVRLAADGTTAWERTYADEAGPELAGVRSVATDGEALVLGVNGVDDGDAGPVVARADRSGELAWTAYLFQSMTTTAGTVAAVDGGYLVGGNVVLQDSEYDYWLATVDREGEVNWREQYADGGYLGRLVADGAHAVFAGSDGADATARRFDPADAPWQDDGAAGTTATSTASEGTTADLSDGTEAGGTTADDGDESGDESGSSSMPGFGVGEAVAGVAGLELLRRRRGD